jgi:hypothetical protein
MRSGAVVLVVFLAALLVVAAEAVAAPVWRVARIGFPATEGFSGSGVSCVSAGDCTAIGGDRFEHWSGVGWSGRSIKDVGLVAISCVVGSCQVVGGWNPLEPRAERLSGRFVRREQTKHPPHVTVGWDLLSVSCASANACVSVGEAWTNTRVDCRPSDFVGICQAGSPLIERWNGPQWSIQPAALPVAIVPDVPSGSLGPGASLSGVSCASARACMAVGSWWQRPQPGGPDHAFAEFWNGTRWALLTPTAASVSRLYGVSCTSPDACTAVGFTAVGRRDEPLVEHWNGRGWQVRSAPDPSPAHSAWLNSVSCVGSSCTAVGGAGVSGDSRPLIERGTRGRWVPQHAPVPAHNRARMGSGLDSVSCGSADSCVAVGSYDNGVQAFVEQYR